MAVGGAAKVIPIEVDISAYASATGGVYVGAAGPFIMGPMTPTLVTNPVNFLNWFTPMQTLLATYDASYWEILNILAYTNLVWVTRAADAPLYAAAYVRASTSSLMDGPAEFGILNINEDYNLNSADGRPELADSVVTFDSDENWLTVPASLYAAVSTGDTCILSTTGTLPLPFSSTYIGIGTSSTTLYIFKTTVPNKIQLAPTLETANADEAIVITSFGIGTQTITVTSKDVADSFVADYTTGILTVNSLLYNTLASGDAVTLSNAGGALPAGLNNSTTYYAIVTSNSQQIMLASDFANATSQTPIPLTFSDNGIGTNTLTITNKSVVGAFTIDQSNDTMAVASDWYSWVETGDQVTLYAPNPGDTTAPDTLTFGTTYYVYKTPTINKIQLATSQNNANNGVVITYADPGSGVVMINDASITLLSETDAKVLLIYASSQGIWGDNISYTLTNYNSNPALVKEPGCFVIQVFYNNGVTPLESWTCTRDPTYKNLQNLALYVEDVLQASQYIRAIDNVAIAPSIMPKETRNLSGALVPFTLFQGSDGATVTDYDMNNAINQINNSNNYPLNLVTDSGWTTQIYQSNIISMCDATQGGRGDCAFILNTPYEIEIQQNYLTALANYKLATLNSVSSYGGIWSPHILMPDNYNSRNIWMSSGSFVTGKMAAQWQTTQPWLPSAGQIRGVINGLGVSQIFSPGDMDYLYDNNINPVRWQRGSGIMIWGQKTLQTRDSDLNRMNARIVLCVIKPALTALLEQFLFDMNTLSDTVGTRAQIVAVITNYMNNVQSAGGVYDFEVVCNSFNNSAQDVQDNTLNVWLLVHITKDIEYIPFSIAIVGYTVSFTIAEGLL